MMKLLVLATVVVALLLPVPGRAAYRLGAGDQLTVKVYEWPGLSGAFSVGPDGAVSFPLLGEVPAAGLSIDGLETAIARALQAKAALNSPPSVAVAVTRYRPFYILGDVEKPGAYAFAPGLTVLQAVGVAGGFFRLSDPGDLRLARDAITHRGAIRSLQSRLTILEATDARLAAEASSSDSIAFPQDVTARAGDPVVAAVIARENGVFKADRSGLDQQIKRLQDLQVLYRNEIESLNQQIGSEKTQVSLVQKELDNMKKLQSQGLALTPRILLLERTIAESHGTQENLQTMIVRARQQIAQAAQAADQLRIKDRDRVNVESEKIARELQDAKAQLETERALLAEAEVTAPAEISARFRNEQGEPTYRLVRAGAQGGKRQVDADTPLQPGDIVEVQKPIDLGLTSSVPGRERLSGAN